ncbi:MAG: hypothetical protein IIB83_02055 [Bacteroidetes bacterium]|nr:hypothetical protein [Bacteroidota bacterium]
MKVILGFSGGLDTSFCTLYLKEKGYDAKVRYCFSQDGEVVSFEINISGHLK